MITWGVVSVWAGLLAADVPAEVFVEALVLDATVTPLVVDDDSVVLTDTLSLPMTLPVWLPSGGSETGVEVTDEAIAETCAGLEEYLSDSASLTGTPGTVVADSVFMFPIILIINWN